MTLPPFRYHPDPIRSGSVVPSDAVCDRCGQARGYVYDGPVYVEDDEPTLCPWCIADGSAHEELDATFVDAEAFPDGTPQAAIEEITERTPGYSAWQEEHWPACCGDATAYIAPVGIAKIRKEYRQLEGFILNHIIYNMGISGGAATRLLQSLDRAKGPTAFVFRCPKCETHHFHVDRC